MGVIPFETLSPGGGFERDSPRPRDDAPKKKTSVDNNRLEHLSDKLRKTVVSIVLVSHLGVSTSSA